MAKGVEDIASLTMQVDSSQLDVLTIRLERVRDLLREIKRDHGISISIYVADVDEIERVN